LQRLFEVIAEDAEFLVVNKPAGLVCHPTKGDQYSSLIARARLYLGVRSEPHMVNRLDRETSGIVILAKSSEASAQLRQIWESRAVTKEYLAVVHGRVARAPFVIDAPLGKDTASPVAIRDWVVEGGAPSRTRVQLLKHFEHQGAPMSLLRVGLLTGRKHQIRIHLSHAGHPIVGDKLYGPDQRLYLAFVERKLTDSQRRQLITENHALHAGSVAFDWRGARRSFWCAPEPWFQALAG
jgi:23S rRNA pseudouridine1911/1915/1917 synthase